MWNKFLKTKNIYSVNRYLDVTGGWPAIHWLTLLSNFMSTRNHSQDQGKPLTCPMSELLSFISIWWQCIHIRFEQFSSPSRPVRGSINSELMFFHQLLPSSWNLETHGGATNNKESHEANLEKLLFSFRKCQVHHFGSKQKPNGNVFEWRRIQAWIRFVSNTKGWHISKN